MVNIWIAMYPECKFIIYTRIEPVTSISCEMLVNSTDYIISFKYDV